MFTPFLKITFGKQQNKIHDIYIPEHIQNLADLRKTSNWDLNSCWTSRQSPSVIFSEFPQKKIFLKKIHY